MVFPMMVRLLLAAMTGSPSAPWGVVLSTTVNEKVVSAASAIVLAPPAWLAALMSAIRSATLDAL